MNEIIVLVVVFLAGLALGAVFFGGLWWTVRRGLMSPNPAVWFLGSMIVRVGIALMGFYLAGGTDWRRWLACLSGFVAARFMVRWLTASDVQASPS